MYQLSDVKILGTNHYGYLSSLDDPGRVRSKIASVVREIHVQRFDFDCNLVVMRKIIT